LLFSNTFTVYTKEEKKNKTNEKMQEEKIIIIIKCSTDRNVKMFIIKENIFLKI